MIASSPAIATEKPIKLVQFYKVSDEHKAFIKDFSDLMKKHPDAMRQFGLVDTGFVQPRAKVIIWKCEDFGGTVFPPDCKPEQLE